MEAELKVVIHLKDSRALVGVQGPATDPLLETLEADSLEAALAAVPGVMARARERWAASPRCPAYVGPPTEPKPATTRAAPTAARQPAAASESQEGQMRPLV